MIQSKVQNIKVAVAKTSELNDENYLNDILSNLKCLTSNYALVLNEASNMRYYYVVKQLFDEASLLQREFFDALFQRGWYCLEKAEQEKIDETIQNLQDKLTEML